MRAALLPCQGRTPAQRDRQGPPALCAPILPVCRAQAQEGLFPQPEDATVVPTGRAEHRFPLCSSTSPSLFAHQKANSNKQHLLLSLKALNFNSSTQRLSSLINFAFIYDLF